MGGKTWAQLDNVIHALEAQNEPQGVSLLFRIFDRTKEEFF